MKRILILSVIALFFFNTFLSASSFFTGNTGGRLNYAAENTSTEYDPNLKLEAFFEGQFNFSDNLWSHLNFSLSTADFLNVKLFSATDAKFKLDEVSVIMKAQNDSIANYFSIYMGTFDPIGSDIFLQRYFGQQPVSSKITESWLGQASSIIYPHFGIGISDVVKLYSQPLAVGLYAYINNEDENYYVLNADLRFAGVYRYLSFDFAGGVGAPLSDNYKGEEVIIAIDKLYWHAGGTVLIGNNYTQSLFLQGGIFNATFTPGSSKSDTYKNDLFLLVEPRFRFKNTHINLTAYSIPQNTADSLLFIDDTLGCNLNIFSDSILIGSKKVILGTNFLWSFPDKYFTDLPKIVDIIKSGDFNINVTPYMSTDLLNGELHMQCTLGIMNFIKSDWYHGIQADIGYRVTF